MGVMNKIKPEQLKALAEWMGYTVSKSTQNNYDIIVGGIVYPDDEQLMEIQTKLIDEGHTLRKHKDKYCFTSCNGGLPKMILGETINEAVVRAAIAMEEGK